MSDPVLHIKDSYFFEVPKVLCPAAYKSRKDFPDVWISLDPEFQEWEFHRQYHALQELRVPLPPEEQAHHEWHEWVHSDHANFAKPFDEFLEYKYQDHLTRFHAWKAALIAGAPDEQQLKWAKSRHFDHFLRSSGTDREDRYVQWSEARNTYPFRDEWAAAKKEASKIRGPGSWEEDKSVEEWSAEKIAAYNGHLSGKILIPQPFGELRNLHEAQSTLINPPEKWSTDGLVNRDDFGFCISKFMLIELVVGLIVCLLFAWLARRLTAGGPPRGKLWNFLETFVVFIRDEIARPALGGGHHEEEHAGKEAPHHEHGGAHGHTAQAHVAHAHDDPATKYTPLLWTIFFFVLGCNLMGMVPWAGAPTGAFAVTFAMALITFSTVIVLGMQKFGFFGFFLNQIPGMDLPWYMAIVIKPMLLVIELLGLTIKHGVLAVRLLANMVAGHLVLLGVMGLAFGAEAALRFTQPGVAGWQWWLTAAISIVASSAFSILELFVAFLQAYIITFLSALFIGAAIHKH
jgi:F-type H+-transporting ATPase subunit a